MESLPPTKNQRLARQFAFLLEADKLKTILRRCTLANGSRFENSAEHSWHLCLMAVVLAEHAREPVELGHVLKMLVVHDIVEIDADDTFVYDTAGSALKAEREQAAAERIFALLPEDQTREIRTLWDEFEARQTPEARFAAALDRLMPMVHNWVNSGGSWKSHGIVSNQVVERNQSIADGSDTLWQYAQELVDAAIAHGFLER